MDVSSAPFADPPVPTMEQINERAALMVKLVDKLLRGRAQPSARHEAAAAVSDVRSFVRAWRPTSGTASAATATKTAADNSMSEEDIALGEVQRDHGDLVRPSADVLLKLAQRGVQLHNNARKLPQGRDGSGAGGTNDWKSATVAYLRAIAASFVSLGSTSSPKDCANLCRLFSKAGDMLIEDAGDDIRALEMFDDAEIFFRRLPTSFYGASDRGGQGPNRLSLSADDLVMAMHKASSRRIEVLSRTTGDVDEMVAGYEQQIKLLTKNASAGMSVSIAMHAASVGEERYKKGDCKGSSRLLRISLQALGGDLDAACNITPVAHGGLRRTILFSLAHCCSQSGDHTQAVQCIKQLEGDARQPDAEDAEASKFLFAKCKVLSDAGDLTGAYVTAEALVDSASLSGTDNLELVTARMIASHEEFSDRSLGLFSKIAARFIGGTKALSARVALLEGLEKAVRLRSDSYDAGITTSSGGGQEDAGVAKDGHTQNLTAVDKAARLAEETAESLIADEVKGVSLRMTPSQVQAVLEAIVVLAEFFQGREEWKACAQWCERAITLAKILPPSPPPGAEEMQDTLETSSTPALEASLLTLRGEMECRMGDFTSSSQSLEQALNLCPTYRRAREVAFWSAARDPSRDESSLSARLSALLGPCAGWDSDGRREYLTECLALVGATTAAHCHSSPGDNTVHAPWDSRVMMVQERLLDALLTDSAAAAPGTDTKNRNGDSVCSSRGTRDADDGARGGRAPMEGGEAAAAAADAVAMDVERVREDDSASTRGASEDQEKTEASPALGSTAVSTVSKTNACGAVQVVAAMVDGVLQDTQGNDHWAGATTVPSAPKEGNDYNPARALDMAILARVLLSIEKALSCAPSLGIGPKDDPDIDYLSKGCWNLAVRCCGPTCDLPWAVAAAGSASRGESSGSIVGKMQQNGHAAQSCEGGKTGSESKNLLVLAPPFFKASRQWTELRSDANSTEALVARQNCTMLGVAAVLELCDSKNPASDGPASTHMGIGEALSTQDTTAFDAGRRGLLERCRKDLEMATGLNRRLGEVEPGIASEMRSVLLVAEISVLSKIGDAVAVRSLVSGRESEFVRCSTNLLQYCVQLAEDVLEDAAATASLCRLCIKRYAEDDPVDTCALGGLYRRLLMCALCREDALAVADEFIARARELQEGPGMLSEDVDYMAAKCYNLGLQLLEMDRPAIAERFFAKALGLLQLGASEAFSRRWGEIMHKVYRSTLKAKGNKSAPVSGGNLSTLIDKGGSSPRGLGGALRAGGAFGSTGFFPMSSGNSVG